MTGHFIFYNLLIGALITTMGSGCSSSDIEQPVDCSTTGLGLTLKSVGIATSCSTADGSITVVANGGLSPYTYKIGTIQNQQGVFTQLRAGIYSVSVIDANRCEVLLPNITVMSGDVSFETSFVEDTECLTGNGAVTITMTDGNPPFQYKIGNGAFSDVNTFTDLQTGSYTVLVQDAESCTLSFQVTVPRGQSGTSWLTEIKPIMDAKCATSGCHNGVSRANNFSLYTDAKKFAAQIKKFTQDRSMPFEGSLTQNQIDLIACWVDDGALQN